MHTGDPLYAMYLQATCLKNNKDTTRRQWIVFPPLDPALAKKAGKDHTYEGQQLVFTREQPSLENRVKWKHYMTPSSLLERDIPERIAALQRLNLDREPQYQWQVSPPIVCQVTLNELVALMDKPTTPWFALKRFEKVARRRHGLSI